MAGDPNNVLWRLYTVLYRERDGVDHPGFEVCFDLLRRLSFSFRLYDDRHWDDKAEQLSTTA